MELERRFCEGQLTIEVRVASSQPVIAGYAAVFNSLSVELWGFRERIAPGAFAGSMEDDVRALWNHDTAIVLGRTKAQTLSLAEDNTGLKIEILPPASAASYVESIQRGDVDQMSFGFRTLEETWDEDAEGVLIRTLTKVKLYEVSPVTFPAYPATSVGVRGDKVTAPKGSPQGDQVTEGDVDPVFGLIPVIPVEYRRALRKTDQIAAEALRAQWARRQRQLQLLG